MGSAVIPIFRMRTCLERVWSLLPSPREEAGVPCVPMSLLHSLPFLGTKQKGFALLSQL